MKDDNKVRLVGKTKVQTKVRQLDALVFAFPKKKPKQEPTS